MKVVGENHMACAVCGSRVSETYKTVATYQLVSYALGVTPQMGSVMAALINKTVVTRDELLGAMALFSTTDEHATHHLKVAISRLRRQIGHRGWTIKNVFKIGYSLDPKARVEAQKLVEAARAAFEGEEDRLTVTDGLETQTEKPLN